MTDFQVKLTPAAATRAATYGGPNAVIAAARVAVAEVLKEGGPKPEKWAKSKFMTCFHLAEGEDAEHFYEFIATPSRDGSYLVVDAGETTGSVYLSTGPLAGKTMQMPGMVSDPEGTGIMVEDWN